MGADIYLESEYMKAEEWPTARCKKLGVHFFDSYNPRGLFAVISTSTGINLNWWVFADEYTQRGWMDERGVLNLEGVKDFYATLEAATETLNRTKTLRYGYNEAYKTIPEEQREEYTIALAKLRLLCKTAIEQKCGLVWSV